MQDNLYTKDEIRDKMASGINKIADAVGGTMGTGGSNAIIQMIESPGYLVTNDGYTIASKIKLIDPIEEMGRQILMEAISRANKASGDGSSTTTVLTRAIIQEGMKHLGDASPMEIKRALEACVPLIEESINAQKREITVDEVGMVASISAEDEQIGNLIQEIYQKIGKDGIIHWDISKTSEDSYTLGKGLTVEGAGIASPYMCDRNKENGQFEHSANLKNPMVIVTTEKLTSAAVFENLFKTLNAKGKKEVVIFCEDFDVTIIAQLVMTQQVQGFRTVVVKTPLLWRDEWRFDLALASGAIVMDPASGKPLKDIKEEDLGTFGHISIDKDTTYIDGIKDLTEHIDALIANANDKDTLRASRLNTKTARLFIGAHSESALSYKRLKVEDAISAAYHALQNGIVAGGGASLVMATDSLPETIGGHILKSALCTPAKQIATNAGFPEMKIDCPDYKENRGFDSKTHQFVDMFEAGIIDPANIVLNAVKNAVSVAATILTANTLVTFPKEENV